MEDSIQIMPASFSSLSSPHNDNDNDILIIVIYRVSQKKRTFRMLLEEEEPQGPWRQKHSWIFPRSAFGAEAPVAPPLPTAF